MFCAGLLLSIADLLVVPTAKICRLQTPSHQSTGAHEPAQYYSMFLEAFPQPQEHGGTTPLGRAPNLAGAPAVGRCEYHTAIRAAFQLELGWRMLRGLTEHAAKCRLSSTRRGRGTRFAVPKFIFQLQLDVSSPSAPPCKDIRGPP